MNERDKEFARQDYVTLREHFEALVGAMDKRIDTRLISFENAVKLAAANMERRLDGMNEFRDTLKDQAGRFVTRDELRLLIDPLIESKAKLEGKASQQAVHVSMAMGLIAMLASIIGAFWRGH